MYTDEDLLMLSGIQHFVFCQRQWALGHIHQLWADNKLTAEGEVMHSKTDDFSIFESRESAIKIHALPITSYRLGLTGIADIVELEPTSDCENAISHPKRGGCWLPHPVEFKHGSSKSNDCDRAQVCAQAMCLEETYGIYIYIGYIFYGKTRHREIVECNSALRNLVIGKAKEMHKLFATRSTPFANYTRSCKNCSLYDLCLPAVSVSKGDVTKYLVDNLFSE